jgi:hypothetical protein
MSKVVQVFVMPARQFRDGASVLETPPLLGILTENGEVSRQFWDTERKCVAWMSVELPLDARPD